MTSVANSISPIVRAQDSQFSCIHCMYILSHVLFELRTKKIGQVPTRLWQVIKMQTFPVKICMVAHAYFSVHSAIYYFTPGLGPKWLYSTLVKLNCFTLVRGGTTSILFSLWVRVGQVNSRSCSRSLCKGFKYPRVCNHHKTD